VQNPYAPPAAPTEPAYADRPLTGTPSDFGRERRPVILCVGLSVLTFSLYPVIWAFRRARFLDSLDVQPKLGLHLPALWFIAHIVSFVVSLAAAGTRDRPDSAVHAISRVLSIGAFAVNIVTTFRIADILQAEFAGSGRPLSVSKLWTFVFGIYYLQFKINQAADSPDRRGRPKKKKRKKKRLAAQTGADAVEAD
jgi:hypothetical protein